MKRRFASLAPSSLIFTPRLSFFVGSGIRVQVGVRVGRQSLKAETVSSSAGQRWARARRGRTFVLDRPTGLLCYQLPAAGSPKAAK